MRTPDGAGRVGEVGAAASARSARNMRVEALRVAAIAGISVFHVFQTWFAAAAVATPVDELDGAARVLAEHPGAMWVLGLIALLGAGGNHVFYMISGFYLIPSAARRSRDAGYWRSQGKAWLRRAALIVASVAVCAAVACVVNLAVPVPGIGSAHWLGLGLEFVWLYLVFVSCAPILGWLFARIPIRVLWTLACVVLVAVYALNAYIAFVSPEGGRGLGDWRKLMSALTYAVSYAFAGLLGMTLRGTARGGARESGDAPVGLQATGLSGVSSEPCVSPTARSAAPSRRRPVPWSRLLVVLVVLVAVAEAWMAWSGARWLLMAMSFKSTSLVSFLGATLALIAAAGSPAGSSVGSVVGCATGSASGPAVGSVTGSAVGSSAASAATSESSAVRRSGAAVVRSRRVRDMWHRLVRMVAAGTLGFYIAQSLLGGVWHDVCDAVMTRLLGDGGGLWSAIAFGCLFAVMFLLVVAALDRVIRQPLMRVLRLM